jgi:hypothetical protein
MITSMIQGASPSNTPSQATLSSSSSNHVAVSDPRDSERNSIIKDIARRQHLAWEFSTPTDLTLVFPQNDKHLVTCEIDLSSGKGAIEVKVETFGPATLFQEMKAKFKATRLQSTMNSCCYCDPEEIGESDSYSFFVFPLAEISDVTSDVISSLYPDGAGTGGTEIKARVVSFAYVLAKEEYKDGGDAVEQQRKKMKIDAMK